MKEMVISVRPVSVRDHEEIINSQLNKINLEKARYREFTAILESMMQELRPEVADKVRAIICAKEKQDSVLLQINESTDKLESIKSNLDIVKSLESFDHRLSVRSRLQQKSK